MTEPSLPDIRASERDESGASGRHRRRRYLPSPQVLEELSGLDLTRLAEELRARLSDTPDSARGLSAP